MIRGNQRDSGEHLVKGARKEAQHFKRVGRAKEGELALNSQCHSLPRKIPLEAHLRRGVSRFPC